MGSRLVFTVVWWYTNKTKEVTNMIDFQKLTPAQWKQYNEILFSCPPRGCEYSFANLYLWGRKYVAEVDGFLLIESRFDRKVVYLFPVGQGDVRCALEALLRDAEKRRLNCCLGALTEEDCRLVEQLYPGKFSFYCDRDSYDYVYGIEELAQLKGRKYQKKRNHLNRFRKEHETAEILPLEGQLLEDARLVAQKWYENRCAEDPDRDYHLEERALSRAFDAYGQLGMEGVALVEEGRVLAFAMGTRLNHDTFDIHFEKAREDIDGAYTAVNQEFARYLRLKYPHIAYLDREEDMGLEGLRKSKLSYNSHHQVTKHWAYLNEDIQDE